MFRKIRMLNHRHSHRSIMSGAQASLSRHKIRLLIARGVFAVLLFLGGDFLLSSVQAQEPQPAGQEGVSTVLRRSNPDELLECTHTDYGIKAHITHYAFDVWVSIVFRGHRPAPNLCEIATRYQDDATEKFARVQELSDYLAELQRQARHQEIAVVREEFESLKQQANILQQQAVDTLWHAGNAQTDAYIFAYNNEKNVRVILEFVPREDGTPEARLYMAVSEEGIVGRIPLDQPDDFSFSPNRYGETVLNINIAHGLPFLRMYPKEGGWFVDGGINYNLHYDIDGPLPPGRKEFLWQTTDGTIDWSSEVVAQENGLPDSQVTHLTYDKYPNWAYTRFGGSSRMYPTERFPYVPTYKRAPVFMPTFPHFEMGLKSLDKGEYGQSGGDISHFRENPLPLYFNMRDHQFQLNGFVGFQIGGTYYYNSLSKFPHVDFESPFAFYSFDPSTRYPHLLVRGTPYHQGTSGGSSSTPDASTRDYVSFRYSWKIDKTDEPAWRYSLDLAGYGYRYDDHLNFANSEFTGLHFNNITHWIGSKTWAFATFVESLNGYGSSEGIYFYSSQAGINWSWLDGRDDDPPAYLETPYLGGDQNVLSKESDITMPQNFRGEYNAAYFREPRVSFSPIDNRPHLWYAQGGVFNIGEDYIQRVHNLNEDAYVDGWTREKIQNQSPPSHIKDPETWTPKAITGHVEELLYALDGYLIYSGPQGSEVRRTDYELSVAVVPSPKDKETWEQFAALAKEYEEKARDPWDMRSWLDAFPGTTVLTAPGAIRNVRTTSDGFRFVVDIEPGYQATGIENGQALAPGEYIVSYDGSFAIETMTPPDISLQTYTRPLVQYIPGSIQLKFSNAGKKDVKQVRLELIGSFAGEERVLIAHKLVDILAGETTFVSLNIGPEQQGTWTVEPRIRRKDNTVVHFNPVYIEVQPPPSSGTFAILHISTTEFRVLPIMVVALISSASLAALTFWKKE